MCVCVCVGGDSISIPKLLKNQNGKVEILPIKQTKKKLSKSGCNKKPVNIKTINNIKIFLPKCVPIFNTKSSPCLCVLLLMTHNLTVSVRDLVLFSFSIILNVFLLFCFFFFPSEFSSHTIYLYSSPFWKPKEVRNLLCVLSNWGSEYIRQTRISTFK